MKNTNRRSLLTWLLAVMLTTSLSCRKPTASQEPEGGPIRAGNVLVIDTRTDMVDRARAKQNVEDTLIRYPDIGCLVGLWNYNGPAILSALKDADRQGKVPVVCFDEEEDTLQGVKDGYIDGTIVQQPYEFGYHSVRILAALARGDKSAAPENKLYDIPIQVICKENVVPFWAAMKKQLEGADAKSSQPAADGQRVHVAIVTNGPSDFWQRAHRGAQEAARALNVDCEFHMPIQASAAEQLRIIEALMVKDISGMAISPCDAENQVEIINRVSKVMNVVCMDSDAPDSNRCCYVGTNNYLAGRVAGKLIKKVLPDGGKIMLFVGQLDAQNAKDRRQGIFDELAGKPDTPDMLNIKQEISKAE